MGVLTEVNYQSRRISRQRDIDAAQERYSTVAFAHELGEATREDVAAAKADLTELQERLAALDSAWSRRQEQIEGETAAAEAQARETALTEGRKLLAKRRQAGLKLEKAVAALIEAYNDYGDAGQRLLSAISPVARHLGRDGFSHLQSDVSSVGFGSGSFLVAGLLAEAQADFSGSNTSFAAERIRTVGVAGILDSQHEQILRRLETLTEQSA